MAFSSYERPSVVTSSRKTRRHRPGLTTTRFLISNLKRKTMDTQREFLSKVPEVTLIFWIIKIFATTLGETGGDAVSMSLNLGYLVSTGIFAAIFIMAVMVQISAKKFHPVVYWITIIATTTVGTTLADFADRSLGIGYAGGTAILLTLLAASLLIWQRVLGSVAVDTVNSPKSEMFYWITIMFSQTLGTGHCAWRLGRRYSRPRLWRGHSLVCCLAGRDRGGILPHKNFTHTVILGGVHSGSATRRCRR